MLFSAAMKYLMVMLVAGGTWLVVAHKAPAPQASAPAYTPGTDFLKAPLDRTHEVLDQARERAKDQP